MIVAIRQLVCFLGILITYANLAGVANAEVVKVKLDLLPASSGVNTFNVDVHVDTLATTLGTLTAHEVIDLSGILYASLQIERTAGQQPKIVGILLDDPNSQLFLSAFQSFFSVPTGELQLEASDWTSQLETPGGFIPIEASEFPVNDMRLILTGGVAAVSVPFPKPSQMGDLSDGSVTGTFLSSILNPLGNAGSIELSELSPQTGSPLEAVDLDISLVGLTLQVNNAGLPVTLTFTSGNLRAAGVIPEPGAAGLFGAALTSFMLTKRVRLNR